MTKKKSILLILITMALIFVGIWFFYPVPETTIGNLIGNQSDVIPEGALSDNEVPENEISEEEIEANIEKTKALPNSITASFVDPSLEIGPVLGEVFVSSDQSGIYAYAVLDVPPAPVGYDYIGWIMGAEGLISPAGFFVDAGDETLMSLAQTEVTADTSTFVSFVVTKQLAGSDLENIGETVYEAVFKIPEVAPVVVEESAE